jgi:hypothetical protein
VKLPYAHRADITTYEGTRYIDCPCGWLHPLDVDDDLGDILRLMDEHLAETEAAEP